MRLVAMIMLSTFILIPATHAQEKESPRVLSFAQWKAQQKVEAENRVVRVSNQLQVAKRTTGNLHKINKLDSELRVAAQGLEYVQELGVEDYFNVYLDGFSDSDSSLVEAARMMTEVEMAQLLKALLKTKAYTISNEDGANSGALTGLASRSQSEAQL